MTENLEDYEYNQLLNKIERKTAIISIIGLGYVGLPLLYTVFRKNYHVIGYDIDELRISNLLRCKSMIESVPDDNIDEVLKSGVSTFTFDAKELVKADVIIICVPTPLTKNREPDTSYINQAINTIIGNFRKGQLIVLESTTYPGTTQNLVQTPFKNIGLNIGTDIFIAYSPEREDPGNNDFNTASTPKIVGADDSKSLEVALSFYNNIIFKTIALNSTATAEAVKLTENIFRLVNISLVNELKIIYEKMDININEVIDAASSKPFGYMPFYPGPGIGGHCIPIDPFYLSWKAKEFDYQIKFIELAGEIMLHMPDYVVNRIREELDKKFSRSIKNSKLLILGVSYKADIGDTRDSPVLKIINNLINYGANVEYYDPHVPILKNINGFDQLKNKESLSNLPESFDNFDAVIICVKHKKIDYKKILDSANLVVDTRNSIPNYGISELKHANLVRA